MIRNYYIILLVCCLMSVVSLLAQEESSDKKTIQEQLQILPDDSSRIAFLINDADSIRYTDIDSSLVLSKQALRLAREVQDSLQIAKSLAIHGMIYTEISQYDKSIEYFQEAVDILNKIEDQILIADVIRNIGNVYWFRKDFDAAMQYYKKAYKMDLRNNNLEKLAGSSINIGITFNQKNEFDSAMFYIKQALSLCQQHNNNYGIALAYLNLGNVYTRKGEHKNALSYYLRVYYGYIQYLTNNGQTSLLISLSEAYFKTGDYSTALKYMNEGLDTIQKTQNLYLLSELNYMGYLIDSAKSDYSSALRHYLSYDKAKDQLKNQEYEEKLANFRIISEVQEKEAQIKKLEAENEIKTIKIKTSKTTRIFIGILFVLSVISLLVLYYAFRIKRDSANSLSKINKVLTNKNELLMIREKELEELNVNKDKFYSIIAHDVRNLINTVIGFSGILQTKFKSLPEEKKIKYIYLINSSSGKIQKLLDSLMAWTNIQEGKTEPKPLEFPLSDAANEVVELLSASADEKKITLSEEVARKQNVYADYSMITTVLRNLVNNAIKFTPEGGQINIQSQVNNNYAKMMVVDNGVGIRTEDQKNLFRIDNKNSNAGTNGETGSGLGLLICKEFIEKNKGQIGFSSKEGEGATFWFTVPLSKAAKQK